jgi:small subunit ribosomal protein SAe
MAPSNLPPIFNATSQDIEMLLAAQCHLGSKNLQVHMEPYLWKTRPDGINVINIGKTWYESLPSFTFSFFEDCDANCTLGKRLSLLPVSSRLLTTPLMSLLSLLVPTASVPS